MLSGRDLIFENVWNLCLVETSRLTTLIEIAMLKLWREKKINKWKEEHKAFMWCDAIFRSTMNNIFLRFVYLMVKKKK